MAYTWVWNIGQSNTAGRSTGATGTYVNWRYWYHDLDDAQPTVLANLATGWGKDVSLGAALIAGGVPYGGIATLGKGGTSSASWLAPGGATWVAAKASIDACLARRAIDFPGVSWREVIIVHHGENEAVQVSGTPALSLATNWITTLEYFMENVLRKNAHVVINQIPTELLGGTHIVEVRAQLATLADYFNGELVDCTGLPTTDGVHFSTAGYISLGALDAAKVLEFFPMGSLTTYSQNSLVDHLNNKATYSPAANHYLHLYSDAECTVPLTAGNSPGYAPAVNVNNTTTWPAPASRAVVNNIAFNFSPTGTGLTALGAKLTDSVTEGSGPTLWQHGGFTPMPWNTTDGPFGWGAGTITITGLSGEFTNHTVHGLLGLMFGGTAFAPLTTIYLSYWSADPQVGGTIVGSAVALTQASTWGSASLGKSLNIATVTLPAQVSSWMAIHSATAGGGTLLRSSDRPTVAGSNGQFLAGQLQVTCS
jgi:hypothetical protein